MKESAIISPFALNVKRLILSLRHILLTLLFLRTCMHPAVPIGSKTSLPYAPFTPHEAELTILIVCSYSTYFFFKKPMPTDILYKFVNKLYCYKRKNFHSTIYLSLNSMFGHLFSLGRFIFVSTACHMRSTCCGCSLKFGYRRKTRY